MNTSSEWLNEVLGNPELMVDWLKKQYHGEVTAAGRIRTFSNAYAAENRDKHTLEIIASQEELHAAWVAELLVSRGIVPEVLVKEERYWNETLPGVNDFHSGAAVASHAERMRLERIRAICEHEGTPDDIRSVFLKILPQEEFHERAFGSMAGVDALRATEGGHERGLEALGLTV